MDKPTGFVRYDELVNILNALARTCALDQQTLSIVAEATGVGPWFRPQPPIVVEVSQQRPALADQTNKIYLEG